MNTLTVTVASYKKAQVFRKDYVRKDGKFIRLEKCSGNHSYATVELADREEFDARGSQYQEGTTRWTAANCQSWAKFQNRGGKLVALKFDGTEIPLPHWCRVHESNLESTPQPEEAAAV